MPNVLSRFLFSRKLPIYRLIHNHTYSFSIEHGNNVIYQHRLDLNEEGPAVDLQFSDTGNSSPLLIYATSFGNIVGWDLRQPFNQLKLKDNEKITPAFKLENDLRDGIVTSMAIFPDQVRFISITVFMVY